MEIVQTAGFTLAILVIASLVLSWLNAMTIQQVVNRTGKANSQLWLMKPGILVHELLHAIVGWLFGVGISGFSMRPDQDSAAHVTFNYNRHSLRQRLGVGLASAAPVWGIGGILLAVGKRAWFHNVPFSALLNVGPQPDWPWVIGWSLLTILLTFGASLSPQDLKNTLIGLPIVVILLGLAALLTAWLWPAGITIWRQANILLSAVVVIMAVIAMVVNRLLALF
ncbi:hypothetical protein [Lacticaseibacillus porcinae]|uniref:hypothetical protein n=1 Tax=Lacticaseibacillus porcinae TaxID=1123687 RepID=UPI000F7A6952|nr:hypothetical protein [Lacticaseibacillus porcinae]